jgi:hypothetical protein
MRKPNRATLTPAVALLLLIGRETPGSPRPQESRRAWRDGCIARMIRKLNHARLTAGLALLL